jgi:hypothetical protein
LVKESPNPFDKNTHRQKITGMPQNDAPFIWCGSIVLKGKQNGTSTDGNRATTAFRS